MPENGKAGVMHRPFYLEEVRWRKCRLCGYGKVTKMVARKGYCRPGCSLLEKVFQRFALQSVQPDILLVIITKGLWSKKQDIKIFW